MRAQSYLRQIGVYGYDQVEAIVLAALITEDPLLLIGKSGTGKTYLLNSLSEAMGLAHRHYNASLIAFDDLVGFPYPTPDHTGVIYLPTPATIWGAESVLIDEISRCKPEHQNRLFSILYERRLQGIRVESLRYRWAAMNPPALDLLASEDSYSGSEALDQALADRFGFIVETPDWGELDEETQMLIADPRGEGALSADGGSIRAQVESGQARYRQLMLSGATQIVADYARQAATYLGQNRIRISPRRARQLARNLLAVMALREGEQREEDFLLVLRWSLPQRAWGGAVSEEAIRAAHRIAWQGAFLTGRDRWLHAFALAANLTKRARLLIDECPDPDAGSLAVAQLLANASKEYTAAFALAVYPLALQGRLNIGSEGVSDLGKVANEVLDLQGELKWETTWRAPNAGHPEYSRLAQILAGLPKRRRERATQLFYYCLIHDITLPDPVGYEREFEACIAYLRKKTR